MSTAYWKNVSGSNWNTDANWFTDAAAITALSTLGYGGVPWIANTALTAYNLAYATGVTTTATINATLGVSGNAWTNTGICSLNLTQSSNVYSGNFSGAFYRGQNLYGGTFTGTFTTGDSGYLQQSSGTTLRFTGTGQTSWTGVVSGDMGVVGNWSNGLPTSGSQVIIPSGMPNNPSSGTCAGTVLLNISTGGTFSNTVRIIGTQCSATNTTFSSALTVAASSTLGNPGLSVGCVCNGSVTVTPGGTVSGGTINGSGTISGGTVMGGVWNGVVSQSVGTTYSGTTFNNTFTQTGGSITGGTFAGNSSSFTNGSGLTISGNGCSNSGSLSATVTGSGFTNTGTINSGTYSGAGLVNNGTITSGTFNPNGFSGELQGGTFNYSVDATGTGWNSTTGFYYLAGVQTTLNQYGCGVWSSTFYNQSNPSVTYYVRAGGNDANNGLTTGTALATVQQAYVLCVAATGYVVIDVDAHTYAGITLSANLPMRIAFHGVSIASSNVGGINGNGTDSLGDYATFASPGFSAFVVSDYSVNIGGVSVNGGSNDSSNTSSPQAPGSVYLLGCYTAVSAVGGSDPTGYNNAANGGNVTSLGATPWYINNMGGSGIYIYGGIGSAAGSITITTAPAVISSVDSSGNPGSGYGSGTSGGNGGNVTLNNSIVTTIHNTAGGNADTGYSNGTNGTITVSNTTFTYIPSWTYSATYVGTTNIFNLTRTALNTAMSTVIQSSQLVLPFADVLGGGLL